MFISLSPDPSNRAWRGPVWVNQSQLREDDDDTRGRVVSEGAFLLPPSHAQIRMAQGQECICAGLCFLAGVLASPEPSAKFPTHPDSRCAPSLMAETRQRRREIEGQVLALPQAPSVTAGDLLHLSMPRSPAVNNTSFPLLCFCPCQFRL